MKHAPTLMRRGAQWLQQRRTPLAMAALSTLLVLIVRQRLITAFAVDVPYWDQWDGEIERLYFKYLNATLTLGDFFLPANEHRIAMTRLLNLAVFVLNGNQLNTILVMRWQALLSVVPVFVCALVLNKNKAQVFSTAILVAFFLPPLGFENLFWAYQSQAYFALVFATIGLCFVSSPKVAWLPITLCCVAGAANMASAMFTSACAAGACLMRWYETRNRTMLFKAPYFLALTYALSLTIWHNPAHEALQSTSVAQYVHGLQRYLVWPAVPFALAGLWVWPAGIWALVLHFKSPRSLLPQQWFGLLLMAWVGMVGIAGAYARTGGIESRYCDYLILGYVGAVLITAPYVNVPKWGRLFFGYQLLLFIIIICAGVKSMTEVTQSSTHRKLAQAHIKRALVAAENGPAAAYEVLTEHPGLDYPDDHVLAKILADPRCQSILRGLKTP